MQQKKSIWKKSRNSLSVLAVGLTIGLGSSLISCGFDENEQQTSQSLTPEVCVGIDCPEGTACFEQCNWDKQGQYSCDWACKPPEEPYPHVVYEHCPDRPVTPFDCERECGRSYGPGGPCF